MILNCQYIENEYPTSLCKLNGEMIENVEKFIYLGSCIKYDQPTTGNAEVELRIDCAENTLYRYGKKFFRQENSDSDSSTYSSILRKMIKGGFGRKKRFMGICSKQRRYSTPMQNGERRRLH